MVSGTIDSSLAGSVVKRLLFKLFLLAHLGAIHEKITAAIIPKLAKNLRIWPEITSRFSARACESLDNEGLGGLRDEWG